MIYSNEYGMYSRVLYILNNASPPRPPYPIRDTYLRSLTYLNDLHAQVDISALPPYPTFSLWPLIRSLRPQLFLTGTVTTCVCAPKSLVTSNSIVCIRTS